MAVSIQKDGEVVIVDAYVVVSVLPQQVWQVLTDYERMPQFMPRLQSSKILERNGGKLLVSQSGTIGYGWFSLQLDSIREVEQKPYGEIRSHVVGGSFKKGEVTTQLVESGGATRITYHSEALSNIWMLLGIGDAMIKGSYT